MFVEDVVRNVAEQLNCNEILPGIAWKRKIMRAFTIIALMPTWKGIIQPMASSDIKQFFDLYQHGFIRVALCIPEVRVADVPFNAGEIVKLARQAAAGDAIFALFPELCISAYSNEDLFHQDAY